MPPGPVFNWLAVAHSALVILDHALQYRAAQVTRTGGIRVSQRRQRARGDDRVGVYKNGQEAKEVLEEQVTHIADEPPSGPTHVLPSSLLHANDAWLRQLEIAATPQASPPDSVLEKQHTTVASTSTITLTAEPSLAAKPFTLVADVSLSRLDAPLSQHAPILEPNASPDNLLLLPSLESTRHLQSSKVPSSRIGRLFHYGGIYVLYTCEVVEAHVFGFQALRRRSVMAQLLNYSAVQRHPPTPPNPHRRS
jgi:hypothetical protein